MGILWAVLIVFLVLWLLGTSFSASGVLYMVLVLLLLFGLVNLLSGGGRSTE